ncbi:MAG: Gldg family protein [Nitrosomonadales bacterium]|nr:Gldg family protein [Nitrosomonadales bacterium]
MKLSRTFAAVFAFGLVAVAFASSASAANVIYFVTGHGEKLIDNKEENGYSYVKDAIERENHQVRELLLVNSEKVPEDAAVLVVSGPETDYLPAELDKITAFVKKGGRVLFMVDPSGGLPKLTSYLGGFGFEFTNDIIFDKTSRDSGSNIAIPKGVQYDKNHPVTRKFEQFTFFPIARSVHIKEDPAKGSWNLVKTSDNSWTVQLSVTSDLGKLTKADEEFDADKHKRGPISVVAVTTVNVNLGDNKAGEEQKSKKTAGIILVVGDSDFAANRFMRAGNKDFFQNMLNWLADDGELKTPALMDVADLILDAKSLNGKKVRVGGFIYTSAMHSDKVFMKRSANRKDTKSIYITTSKLSREQRKKILMDCDSQLCQVIVTGTMEDIGYTVDITAEKLEF